MSIQCPYNLTYTHSQCMFHVNTIHIGFTLELTFTFVRLRPTTKTSLFSLSRANLLLMVTYMYMYRGSNTYRLQKEILKRACNL